MGDRSSFFLILMCFFYDLIILLFKFVLKLSPKGSPRVLSLMVAYFLEQKKNLKKKLLLNVFTVILLSYHSSFGWKNFKMLQVTALIR